MKRFLALFLAVVMLALVLASCNSDTPDESSEKETQTTISTTIDDNSNNGPNSGSNGDNTQEQGVTPTYKGMTVSNTPPSYATAMVNVITLSAPPPVNNDPFGDGNKGLKDKLKEKVPTPTPLKDEYYAHKNTDVYILIHFDNPSEYEIQSFTLGGKKYANYMFEAGSTLECLIVKVNVGDAENLVEYTIDAIKYIDGTKIKDVKLDGKTTVKVNIVPENQPKATIEFNKIAMTSIDLTVNISDPGSFIPEGEDNLFLVVYDGEDIINEIAISSGQKVTVDNLLGFTTYQFAVIAVYDALDGEGEIARILVSYSVEPASHLSAAPSIGDLDFDGAAINVLVRNDYKVQKEWGYIETPDVDALTVEIEKRNTLIKNNLNIDVYMIYLGDQWASTFNDVIMSAVQADVDCDLNAYDIVGCYGYMGLRTVCRDYWANLLDKDIFPYFDFSLRCWNQSLINNGTANEKLYLCAGDMNLSMFDSAMIMWHNVDLYEDLLEATNDTSSPKSIQDAVISGEWTFTELYKWAAYYENKDLESNKGDIYGLYMNGERWPSQPFDAIPYACDLEFIKTNADGTHSFNYRDNDKAETAMAMFRNLWGQKGVATETTGGPSFPSGNLLFSADTIWFSEESHLARRSMIDRHSLTPWPKFDETQERYATTSQDYLTTMAVIDHSQSSIPTKGDVISAYLQYAAEYSYINIRMLYFKEIVEPKYFGNFDDTTTIKSVAIFNTIIDNIEFDFGTIYGGSLENVIAQCWRYNVLLKYTGYNKELGQSTVLQKYLDKHETYDKALVELDIWLGLIKE